MEIFLSTSLVGGHMQIYDDRPEMRIRRVWFALHLRVRRWKCEMEFYRTEVDRPLYFHIKLPFFWVNNDVSQEVRTSVSTGEPVVMPVTIGKVLWKKIYRGQFKEKKNG